MCSPQLQAKFGAGLACRIARLTIVAMNTAAATIAMMTNLDMIGL
jgi:hypothetical protein